MFSGSNMLTQYFIRSFETRNKWRITFTWYFYSPNVSANSERPDFTDDGWENWETHAALPEPLPLPASDIPDQAGPNSAHCTTPLEDDIKTEYHPHSGHAMHVDHFNEYGFPSAEAPKPKPLDEPWHPFHSCIDFEFAEIALKSHLNRKTVNKLIAILHACSSGDAPFTLNSHDEMWEILQGASNKLTAI